MKLSPFLLLLLAAATHSVKLSNVQVELCGTPRVDCCIWQLPICTDGTKLITGEADVMAHQGAYYLVLPL